jgi:hypothetical protein
MRITALKSQNFSAKVIRQQFVRDIYNNNTHHNCNRNKNKLQHWLK